MLKNYKTLILSVVFILPILVFLFLNLFGKNYYKLNIYYPLDSIQIGEKWQVTKYHTLPDFQLKDQNNHPFKRSDLKGKIVVADYFFTSCGNPALCPQMSSEMMRVQERYKEDKEVILTSFTVDPKTDTPEVLKQYGKRYQAIDGKWFFLTGEKKNLYDLAYHGFKINAGEEKDTVNPEFLHAVKFMLVDKEGRIRGYYDGTDRADVDKLMVEIEILKYEYKNQSK